MTAGERFGRLRSLRRRAFARDHGLALAGSYTMVFQVVGLGGNFVTGVIIARGLGSIGRGQYAAISIVPAVSLWIFSMGAAQATAYYFARRPQEGARIIGSWLALMVPLVGGGLLVAELLLPQILATQTAHVLLIARIAMIGLLVGFLYSLFSGVLGGDQDFFFLNVAQFLRLSGLAVLFAVLLVTGWFTVTTAIFGTSGVDVCVTTACMVRAIRRHGVGAPDRKLALESLWYGFRAHGQSVGGFVTGRLDVFLMPSVLAASSIGLYSVATNVSGIVGTLSGTLAALVLPIVAARGPRQGVRIVVASMHATLFVGGLLGVVFVVLAGPAVNLVYGAGFHGSVFALQLLVPGNIALSAAAVLGSGLAAINRPGRSSLIQVPGAILTIVGLALFLKPGGIVAAAVVSTVSYTAVFVTALLLYRRAAALRWNDLLPTRDELAMIRRPRALFGD